MFSGGDYEEVARWLGNFVVSHAKRESPRAEAILEADGARVGKSYGIRVSLGDRLAPPPDRPPIELSFEEVARERGSLTWCQSWADRLRALVRELTSGDREVRKSA
jgi:hypothetical protein